MRRNVRLRERFAPSEAWENRLWRALAAYCLSLCCLRLVTGVPLGTLTDRASHLFPLFVGTLICFLLFSLLRRKWRAMQGDSTLTVLCFGLLSALSLLDIKTPFYPFLLTALWAVLFGARFRRKREGLSPGKAFSYRLAAALCLTGGALFVLTLGVWGLLRVKGYQSPNFDYGIFCQSFFAMRRTGLPVVTSERDRLLSHFAVHLSPSLYLLLPLFWLFPFPGTLNVLQALALGSAGVPLFLLCRARGLSPKACAGVTLLLFGHPAVNLGVGYDFHENCLLLPLLLWTFYFFERQKTAPAFGFALLTLGVKEDAAVYVLFFALYVFFGRGKRGMGLGLFSLAAAYFAGALWLLSSFGDGVMAGRYGNFIVSGGLPDAVRNVLTDPLYVLTQVLRGGADFSPEKLLYLCQTLLPLGLLPLACKKPARLFLLCPLLLVNLMTLYPYQFDIGFQYGFGSAACLLYLTALNVPELPAPSAKTALCTALACALLCAGTGPAARTAASLKHFAAVRSDAAALDAYFAAVPRDAAVAATSFFIPRLSDRAVLYEDRYHTPTAGERLDLVLLDARYGTPDEAEKFLAAGYVHTATLTNDGRELVWVCEPGEERRGHGKK